MAHNRTLEIYDRLLKGEGINTAEAARLYSVSTKTIRRDIDDIRSFLSNSLLNNGTSAEVVYDRAKNCYRLSGNKKLTEKEVFAVCKILLESRAFCREEFTSIMENILESCIPSEESRLVKKMVNNEAYHYQELKHKNSW